MSIVKAPRAMLVLAGIVCLSACSLFQAEYPEKEAGPTQPNPYDEDAKNGGSLLSGWFSGSSSSKKADNSANAIGINSYLWRASLETLSFIPLASADPFGGVIITDWYAPPESPTERFKMSVYITDRDLHADGIKVNVFRQVKSAGGGWADAPVAAKTAGDLENAILTRARELRTATMPIKKS